MIGALAVVLVLAALNAAWYRDARRAPALLANARAAGAGYVAGLLALSLWLAPVRDIVVATHGSTADEMAQAARARHGVLISSDITPIRRGAAAGALAVAPDLAALSARYPAATDITLLGPGLDAGAWNAATDLRVAAASDAPGAAFTAVRWPQQVAPGAPLAVTGAVQGIDDANATVQLVDPGGDVVATSTMSVDGTFALRARTRAAGQFFYRAVARNASGDVLAERRLAVDVRAPPALRLLALWGAPSFEARFLHDWARRGGAEVLARTRLGEALYRTAATNTSWPDDTRITQAQIAQLDVVVADGRAWSALPEQERAAIERALTSGELGLVIVPPLPTAAELGAIAPPLERDGEYPVALPGAAATLVPAAGFWPDAGTASVITTQQGQALAQRAIVGNGRLIASTVYGSHRLVLAGAPQAHADYWQTLFDAALPEQRAARWSAAAPVAPTDAPWVACSPDAPPAMQPGAARYAPGAIALPAFATKMGRGCVLTVSDPGWFGLGADSAAEAAPDAQWHAETPHARSRTSLRAPLAAPGAVSADGPRAPRVWLAGLALLLASTLWWLERALWRRDAQTDAAAQAPADQSDSSSSVAAR